MDGWSSCKHTRQGYELQVTEMRAMSQKEEARACSDSNIGKNSISQTWWKQEFPEAFEGRGWS